MERIRAAYRELQACGALAGGLVTRFGHFLHGLGLPPGPALLLYRAAHPGPGLAPDPRLLQPALVVAVAAVSQDLWPRPYIWRMADWPAYQGVLEQAVASQTARLALHVSYPLAVVRLYQAYVADVPPGQPAAFRRWAERHCLNWTRARVLLSGLADYALKLEALTGCRLPAFARPPAPLPDPPLAALELLLLSALPHFLFRSGAAPDNLTLRLPDGTGAVFLAHTQAAARPPLKAVLSRDKKGEKLVLSAAPGEACYEGRRTHPLLTSLLDLTRAKGRLATPLPTDVLVSGEATWRLADNSRCLPVAELHTSTHPLAHCLALSFLESGAALPEHASPVGRRALVLALLVLLRPRVLLLGDTSAARVLVFQGRRLPVHLPLALLPALARLQLPTLANLAALADFPLPPQPSEEAKGAGPLRLLAWSDLATALPALAAALISSAAPRTFEMPRARLDLALGSLLGLAWPALLQLGAELGADWSHFHSTPAAVKYIEEEAGAGLIHLVRPAATAAQARRIIDQVFNEHTAAASVRLELPGLPKAERALLHTTVARAGLVTPLLFLLDGQHSKSYGAERTLHVWKGLLEEADPGLAAAMALHQGIAASVLPLDLPPPPPLNPEPDPALAPAPSSPARTLAKAKAKGQTKQSQGTGQSQQNPPPQLKDQTHGEKAGQAPSGNAKGKSQAKPGSSQKTPAPPAQKAKEKSPAKKDRPAAKEPTTKVKKGAPKKEPKKEKATKTKEAATPKILARATVTPSPVPHLSPTPGAPAAAPVPAPTPTPAPAAVPAPTPAAPAAAAQQSEPSGPAAVQPPVPATPDAHSPRPPSPNAPAAPARVRLSEEALGRLSDRELFDAVRALGNEAINARLHTFPANPNRTRLLDLYHLAAS